MKIVDLFCGGGGSSTGFHQAGFETVYAIDKEWHCVKTFDLNYPDVVVQKDISKLRSETIFNKINQKPDLVIASPPCEPYTSANEKRIKNSFSRMFDDEIGRLMVESLRIIADLDPQFFLIENVTGVYDGSGKELLQEESNRLGLGNLNFYTLDANRWGVPSHRTRAFITNFKLSMINSHAKSVMETIGDLPPVNSPTKFDYHITPNISSKLGSKVPITPQGEALVYFKGAHEQMRNYLRLYGEQIAPVVMGKSRFIHPTKDRLLTPQEHGRLMSFPDDYKYSGSMEEIYDIIGEAVPPKLTFEIGKQIKNFL